MLSEEQKEYLRQYQEKHKEAERTVNFDAMRQMNKRIRAKALEAIDDLTLIAKVMPENQKEQIFTKDTMRELIKQIFKDGDGRRFGYAITDEETKSNWPEPIYNERVFDMGVLFADFGISSAYSVISWRQRFRDINNIPTKGEMWKIIDNMNNYKYILEGNEKNK